MSHELRTPLNSLLILAEQLEDNPDHNMTDTQVQYASVIRASGNDLLTLLNSILDLAKVESGTVDGRADRALPRRAPHGRCCASSSWSHKARVSAYSIDIAPGTPDDHRHRPAAPPPDPQEPPRQRLQVHRARRASTSRWPGRPSRRLEP